MTVAPGSPTKPAGESPRKRYTRRAIQNPTDAKSGASTPIQRSPTLQVDGVPSSGAPPRPHSTPLRHHRGNRSGISTAVSETPSPSPDCRPTSKATYSRSGTPLDAEDRLGDTGKWSLRSSLSMNSNPKPSQYDMAEWNRMASDDIKPPKRGNNPTNAILNRIGDGSLKLDDKEVAALLKAQEEIDKEDEGSSRDSSEERTDIAKAKSGSPRHARAGNTPTAKDNKDRFGALSNAKRKSAFSSALEDEMLKLKHLHFNQGLPASVIDERIATFFDQQGVLSRRSPTHWALKACNGQPLHQSCKHHDRPAGLSRRQQTLNARNTLELDQMRRDAKIKLEAEQRSEDPRIMFAYDAQQERYLRLMFEPMNDFWENMPDDILDESLDRAIARKLKSGGKNFKGRSVWKRVKQGQTCVRLMGKQRCSDISLKSPNDQGGAGGLVLTNEQRTILLNIFQRYVLRVSGGANCNDLVMARSTWFRFLHHCGVLGPEVQRFTESNRPSVFIASPSPSRWGSDNSPTQSGLVTPLRIQAPRGSHNTPVAERKTEDTEMDVHRQGGATFSHASAVFAMYSEANMGPPTLTFASWVNAIQHILRGPSFYRTHKEVLLNLFGVCLKRCENVLGIQAEKKDASPTRNLMSRRSFSPKTKEAFASADGGIDMAPCGATEDTEPGVLGWQSFLAEEQMCEPEVLLMLHEHEVPLRAIFEYYATRAEREANEKEQHAGRKKNCRRYISCLFVSEGDGSDSASQAEDGPVEDVEEDTEEAGMRSDMHTPSFSALPQKSEFIQETQDEANTSWRPEVVMDGRDFRFMAHELGLFPGVVQLHSVKQHVAMSLARREATKLTYEAYVECLLRIAFVYLSIYGNNVQQASFSKAKCMWLLTLLRVRCNELKLPNGLSADEQAPQGESPQATTYTSTSSRYASEVSSRFCGAAWENTTAVNLDTMYLQDLVLWDAVDSEAPENTRPKLQLPIPTASCRRSSTDGL